MTTGHVFIAMSLDGFIARQDGTLDWLDTITPLETDDSFDIMMASVDGLIMGRGTYEKILTFGAWPYKKPVIVLSQTLTDQDLRSDLRGKVWIVNDSPDAVLKRVEEDGWSRAYIDGGKLIQSFLRAGLISDMILTRIPVLIGQGIPLFGTLNQDIILEHVTTKHFLRDLFSPNIGSGPRHDQST